MAAFIVVDLTPIDTEKLAEYSAKAAKTLIPFEGEFLVKGPIDSLYGEANFAAKVIIQFPSNEQAKGWYNSEAYQSIIDLRNKGMNSQFHLIG